jgi:hypothetical protein
VAKKDAASGAQRENKSAAIRGILTADPNAPTTGVIAELGGKGVKVSPTRVYYVRSKLKQAGQKAKRARVAESSRSTGVADPVELVLRVKDLAREVGGMGHLKQLVDLLAE